MNKFERIFKFIVCIFSILSAYFRDFYFGNHEYLELFSASKLNPDFSNLYTIILKVKRRNSVDAGWDPFPSQLQKWKQALT